MASASAAQASTPHHSPSDADIQAILTERIDVQKQSLGMVVGLVAPDGRRRIVAHGVMASDDARPVGADTLYEIGSVTKVFTALLLADMVRRGEAALADPLAKYLPGGVASPERGGRPITLADLATHTSGLPGLPEDFAPQDPGNPYADYSVAALYAFLSGHVLTRDIGTQYAYSNLGYGLLGQALARRAGLDYEALVHARIAAPLGMTSTMATVTGEARTRFAGAHNPRLKRVQHWDLPTLAGAGALRSTARDLLNFLEAILGHRETPLSPAVTAMLAFRRPMGIADVETGLGWVIAKSGGQTSGDEMIWHNGGTGGHQSFIGYLARARTGVVVLSNTSNLVGVHDIGQHLLNRDLPLAPPVRPRVAVAVAPDVLESYAGRYQLDPALVLTVTHEAGRLFVQATGQPKVEVLAESATDFFTDEIDAQLSFDTDSQGRAVQAVLHQGGQDMPAPRLAS
ncbi:serine hydrolase [Phreatobacter stygius]|uniref:Serine hydrolase n=1 Tax=Phreatobacter stygius TaxID=1940610 RepID=A0A4D7B458_9HYPH|nr:serine hydrolase [Phreatobacter stygius]QCI62932.1 serine hydrolase [Phreatobacter stygius]